MLTNIIRRLGWGFGEDLHNLNLFIRFNLQEPCGRITIQDDYCRLFMEMEGFHIEPKKRDSIDPENDGPEIAEEKKKHFPKFNSWIASTLYKTKAYGDIAGFLIDFFDINSEVSNKQDYTFTQKGYLLKYHRIHDGPVVAALLDVEDNLDELVKLMQIKKKNPCVSRKEDDMPKLTIRYIDGSTHHIKFEGDGEFMYIEEVRNAYEKVKRVSEAQDLSAREQLRLLNQGIF